jgi:hypothetical protein
MVLPVECMGLLEEEVAFHFQAAHHMHQQQQFPVSHGQLCQLQSKRSLEPLLVVEYWYL